MSSTFQARTAKRAARCARRNAIAFAALFVALSGSAYAANEVTSRDLGKKAVKSKNIALGKKAVKSRNIARKAVRSPHIRRGSIRPPHIRKNAIRTRHVRNGGLRTKDVRGLDKSIKRLGNGLITTGGYIGSLLGDVTDLKKRMSDAESKNTTLASDLSALESQVNSLSSSSDSRLDALCAQADTVNQEVRDLRDALAAAGIVGLDLSDVTLPDFDPAECEG